MHVQGRPIKKKTDEINVVPKAIARKTGFNKNAVPRPKGTGHKFTSENQPRALTVKERLERVDMIYELILENLEKSDICELFCEKYGLKPAGFDPWRKKARDQLASDSALTREDRRNFYDKKVKKAVDVCFQRSDMKSAAPLLDGIAKYKAEYGKEEKDDKAINIHFSLADLHKHVEQQNPGGSH